MWYSNIGIILAGRSKVFIRMVVSSKESKVFFEVCFSV